MKRFSSAPAVVLLLALGCSQSERKVEYYYPGYRQLPPEPVYNRLTWSHLPQPVPHRARSDAPLIHPSVSFELAETTLQEAVEAVAQTVGYDWRYPQELALKRVSVNMQGTVEEILIEIAQQAGAEAYIDHQNRLIKIVGGYTTPSLPGLTGNRY